MAYLSCVPLWRFSDHPALMSQFALFLREMSQVYENHENALPSSFEDQLLENQQNLAKLIILIKGRNTLDPLAVECSHHFMCPNPDG